MNRDAILDVVLTRCGRRQNDTTLRAAAEAEFVLLQATLESGVALPIEMGAGVFWPWFLLSEEATRDTVAGEDRIGLPNDFLMEYEDGALFIESGETPGPEVAKWIPLDKEDYDFAIVAHPGQGKPENYSLVGKYFRLHPEPDDVYKISMIYYASQDVPSTDIENQWMIHAPDLLVASLGHIIADKYLYNQKLAAGFATDVAKAVLRLHNNEGAREITNRDLAMGGND